MRPIRSRIPSGWPSARTRGADQLADQLGQIGHEDAQLLVVVAFQIRLSEEAVAGLHSNQFDRAHQAQQLDAPGRRLTVESKRLTDIGEASASADGFGQDPLVAGELTARSLDGHQLNPGIFEDAEKLPQLVSALEPFGDQAAGVERQPHHVVRLDLTFPEQQLTGGIGKQGSNDLLHLVLDPCPQLARGQKSSLDENLPESGRRREAALGVAQLFEGDHPGAQQALPEAIHPLVGASEHDLTLVQVDRLPVVAVGEVDEAGFTGCVNRPQHVEKGKDGDLGAQGRGATTGKLLHSGDALEDDGPGTGLDETKPLTLRQTKAHSKRVAEVLDEFRDLSAFGQWNGPSPPSLRPGERPA